MPGVRFEIDPSQATAAIKSLQADLKGLGLTTGMTIKDMQGLETRLVSGMGAKKGQEALDRLRQSCGLTSTEMIAMHLKTKNYGGVLDEVGRKASEFKDNLLNIKTALAALGAGMVVKDIVDVGANFEHSMNIVRAVSGATAEEFKQLQSAAREIGRTTEWGAQAASQALEDLTKAGLTVKQSIEALPQVVDFATAANLSLGRSAEISSNMMRMMGFEVNQMGRIMDVFLKTANLSTIGVEDMVESFSYVGPVGKMFGYSLEQMAAMIGVLGNSSIKGSMAGTQLTQAIAGTAKVAKELGLGPGAMLIDVLKEMEKQNKGASWTMQEFTDRAARAVGILKDAIPDINKFEQSITGISGTTQDLAEIMRSDVQNSIRIFKAQLESMKLDIFERFGDSIKNAVAQTADYIKENKELILDFAGSIGELLKTLGQFSLHVAGLFANAVAGWNTLPSVIQEMGIVGALVGGTKMRLAIIAIAELLGLGKKAIDWATGAGQKVQKDVVSSFGHSKDQLDLGIKWAEDKIKETEKRIAELKNPPKSLTGQTPITQWLSNHASDLKRAQEQLKDFRKVKEGYVKELQEIQAKGSGSNSAESLLDLGSGSLRFRNTASKKSTTGTDTYELTDEEKQAIAKREAALKSAKILLEQLSNVNLSEMDKQLLETDKQFIAWKKDLKDAKAPQEEFTRLAQLQQQAINAIKTEAARTEIQRYADTMSSVMQGMSDVDPRQAFMKEISLQSEYQKKRDSIMKADLDKSHQEALLSELDFWQKRQQIINENDAQDALVAVQVGLANEFASISENFQETDARYWEILGNQSEAAYNQEVTRIKGLVRLLEEQKKQGLARGDSAESLSLLDKQITAYYKKLELLSANKADNDRKRWREQMQYMGTLETTGIAAWEEFKKTQESESQMMYDMWINIFKAAEQGVSDIFFNVLTGKIKSIGDVLKSLLLSIRDSIIRTIADIAAQKFVLNIGTSIAQGFTGSFTQGIAGQAGSSLFSSFLGGGSGSLAAGTPVAGGGFISPYGGVMYPAEIGAGALYAPTAGAAGAASTGGLGSGLVSIGGSLYALGSGALSYGTSFLGGSLMQLGATNTGYGLFTSGLGGSAAGFNAGASFGSGVSSLGPYALAGAGGYYGGQYFSQNILGQHGQYAGVGGAGGAMAGMYAGSAFGPVGMAVGALLGALAGSALGGIGPDKYAHAGYRTTNVGEYLSRYDKTPTSELPEGALAFQEMIDSLSDSVSDLPEWMGGKYRSDVADTIREIKDFDVTFWVNRNREATGNMSTSLEELQKVFATGYDNLDSVSQESMLKMLNVTEKDLPEALKKGLDAYTQEVTAYYEQITEKAGNIFAQAIGAGLQSTSLTSASQAFANTLATQVSNAIAEALTEKLKTTSIYERLMDPFLTGIDTAIEGSTSAGLDYRGMINSFSSTLSTTPTTEYNPDSIKTLLQRLGGTSTGESNYIWQDVAESDRQVRVNTNPYGLQYYAGMSDATALSQISRLPSNYLSSISTLTGPSQYQQFTQMYENLQAINRTDRTGEVSAEQMWNMLQGSFGTQFGLSSSQISDLEEAYATSAFNPEQFSTAMDEYIAEFESQMPQTVKMFEQVFSVYEKLDQQLNAEQYAQNITDILSQADVYSGEMSGRIDSMQLKVTEVNNQFDSWVELLRRYGATEDQLADLLAGGSFREEALANIEEADQATTELVANFSQALSSAFAQTNRSSGYRVFLAGMKQGVYDTILNSIIQAFIASTAYQNAMTPFSNTIQDAFDQAMSEGSFDTTLYQSLIAPAISSLQSVLSGLEPMFNATYDLMASVGSDLIDNAMETAMDQSISQFASNIGDAFIQATSAEGFTMFTTNVKQGMFDAVSQGIISAFLTSDIYQSVMGPLTSAINEAFTQAMTGGSFNESLFRSLIQSPMAMLDTTLSSLQPMFDSIYGLISYVGSRTIRTSNLVGGTTVEAYAAGGLTSGISIAGEAGSEWIVPTYEPQRSQFLKDVGVDMEILGRSLANGITINNPYIMPEYDESPVGKNYKQITPQTNIIVQNGTQSNAFSKDDLQEIGKAIAQNIMIPEGGGEVHMHIYLDSKDISSSIAYELEKRGTPRLEDAIRSIARR